MKKNPVGYSFIPLYPLCASKNLKFVSTTESFLSFPIRFSIFSAFFDQILYLRDWLEVATLNFAEGCTRPWVETLKMISRRLFGTERQIKSRGRGNNVEYVKIIFKRVSNEMLGCVIIRLIREEKLLKKNKKTWFTIYNMM